MFLHPLINLPTKEYFLLHIDKSLYKTCCLKTTLHVSVPEMDQFGLLKECIKSVIDP